MRIWATGKLITSTSNSIFTWLPVTKVSISPWKISNQETKISQFLLEGRNLFLLPKSPIFYLPTMAQDYLALIILSAACEASNCSPACWRPQVTKKYFCNAIISVFFTTVTHVKLKIFHLSRFLKNSEYLKNQILTGFYKKKKKKLGNVPLSGFGVTIIWGYWVKMLYRIRKACYYSDGPGDSTLLLYGQEITHLVQSKYRGFIAQVFCCTESYLLTQREYWLLSRDWRG